MWKYSGFFFIFFVQFVPMSVHLFDEPKEHDPSKNDWASVKYLFIETIFTQTILSGKKKKQSPFVGTSKSDDDPSVIS